MAKLSDLQLAALLDEIACTMHGDGSLETSLGRLEQRRLGGIARAAAEIRERLERGETLPAAIGQIDSPLRSPLGAAVEACQRCGSSRLLAAIANQLRLRHQYRRLVQIAWIYPLVLLSMGYLIATFVFAPLIRQYHGRDIAWPDWLLSLAQWLEAYAWWPPIIFLLLLAAFALLFAGGEFPRSIRMRLFCQSLADQIQHEVGESEAIQTAAIVSGDRRLIEMDEPTLNSPQIQRILATATADKAMGLTHQQLLVGQLRYLACWHAGRASRWHSVCVRVLPRITMILIGGGLVFAYSWWVIAPVYLQVAKW